MGTVEKLGDLLTEQGAGEIVSRKLRGDHRFYLTYNDIKKEFTFTYHSNKQVNFIQFECKGFSVIPISNSINCVSVKGFESLFMRVMDDLYTGSKTIDNNYVDRWIMKRLRRWKNFFEHNDTEKMSKETQMGLFGELSTLLDLYKSGVDNAVLFWQGPERMEHDFVLPNICYECKVTSLQSKFVRIHGAYQLYSRSPLILRVYKCSISDALGHSLHDLVELCQSYIAVEHEEIFDELLGKYGYISNQVDVYKFYIEECIDYIVRDGFPRQPIINGTDKVDYNLILDDCEPFKL